MKVIFEARSTNGRWGMAIVGPDGTKLPAQGSLSSIGTVAGIETYQFYPGFWPVETSRLMEEQQRLSPGTFNRRKLRRSSC